MYSQSQSLINTAIAAEERGFTQQSRLRLASSAFIDSDVNQAVIS